ncbi:MAG TPA: CapA family protein, partial [Spirochaetota bacterium]|nr:CapA family protein [Spirochaetota bacterium]
PQSVYTVLKIMDKIGYKNAKRYYHTNSDDFKKTNELSTTSHQYFSFFDGEIKKKDDITVLITGNITIPNDKLFIQTQWNWDRNYDVTNDKTITHYLKKLRGEEDRFFVGTDLYIFEKRELNIPEYFNINKKIVAVIKFDENQNEYQKQVNIISKLKNEADFTIVIYQFSDKKLLDIHKKIARKIIDSGASIFIGKGLIDIKRETYKGKTIFYGLGDFIGDKKNSKGDVIGLVLNKNDVKIYKIPIKITEMYPEIDF